MESTLLFMIGLTSCFKSYRLKLQIVQHKNKKASNIFKMGVQFLSDWCKNATKGFDVLEVLGRIKTTKKRKPQETKNCFLQKVY
ncbi:hypothetical protein [Helicobacter pylori]|uniref:hypothetical protein n=1 Tax=Helicobacter pylori TaxID=210 RepID=UPI001E526B1E|nr:hypothetical protein [Helicobacter pylori]